LQLTLKAARVNAGFTQQEAADLLQMSVPNYQRLEVNPGRIRLDRARVLAEMFGVSTDDIFFESNYSSSDFPEGGDK